MKPHIANFLKFLESKDNRKVPLVAKLRYPDKVGPLTKEDLNIEGDLNLVGSRIESLPDNLTVKGHLTTANYNIKSLPDNLTVGGDLDLTYGSKITSLPDNLKVGGDLQVWGTSIGWNLSAQQIRQEIEKKGGYVKGEIKNTIWQK
jgi:hypothetical protein